jgi:hypothetical protein
VERLLRRVFARFNAARAYNLSLACIDGIFLQDTVDREQQKDMTEEEREQAKAAVVTSVGAGVGSAAGRLSVF